MCEGIYDNVTAQSIRCEPQPHIGYERHGCSRWASSPDEDAWKVAPFSTGASSDAISWWRAPLESSDMRVLVVRYPYQF